MTKRENEYVICSSCGEKIPRMLSKGKYITMNGTIRKCNACEWIYHHIGVPVIENFTEDEIRKALHFFYNDDDIYINSLSSIINRNLDDCIFLFRSLKITNRKCRVKLMCEKCGKEYDCTIFGYISSKYHYCSRKCYWEDKSNKSDHGENSKFYNRIKTYCTNCGKEINVIPYSYDKKNRFNDNHNFCCYQCYWEYRSKYYVGDKSVNWHRQYTKEQHDRMAITAITNARKTKTRDTKIQLSIDKILEKHKIRYEREYFVGYSQIDNYLCDYNLMIEVQGDYWHVNPLIYNSFGRLINDTQAKDIIQDKKKHTLLKNKGIEILYLWESDIKNDIALCEDLILKYIENNGLIENYHSFNWEKIDGELRLKEYIIDPYQSLPYSETKKILKPLVS